MAFLVNRHTSHFVLFSQLIRTVLKLNIYVLLLFIIIIIYYYGLQAPVNQEIILLTNGNTENLTQV